MVRAPPTRHKASVPGRVPLIASTGSLAVITSA
jgi:hypothetical protein